MIKYVRGNIFQKRMNYDVIAHGVNCSSVFASGFCEQVLHRYPLAKVKYHDKDNSRGWKLGDVQMVPVDFGYLANCGTQKEYRKSTDDEKSYIDYDSFELCLRKLHKYCSENDKTIAIPKIGYGRGGGDWQKIRSIIERVFKDHPIHIYYI